MARYSVCVSFDWENDRRWRFLLSAWDANPKFDLSFTDLTPGEVNTHDVGRVKAAITPRIKAATHTLVIVGAFANTPHRDRALIGYRNWIAWEVAQSKAFGNRLVAVKLQQSYAAPDDLYSAGAKWATFSTESILRALREA